MATRSMRRLKADLTKFHVDPPHGIYLYTDDENLTDIHAMIIGPKGTPYEGGFFYFVLKIPDDYPNYPPKVTFKTTGHGTVRFNPNLYDCGKVCLSILGTWEGPGWTPIMSISTVLISIQSLLNEEPYYNEPGYESFKNKAESDKYNRNVRSNNIIHAVIGILDKSTPMPESLLKIANQHFLDNYSFYIDVCNKYTFLATQIKKLEILKKDLLK